MRIFTSNKKIVISFLVILFSSFGCLIFGVYAFPRLYLTSKPVNNQKLVIIDPGHGGEDGGAVVEHETGKPIIEKNINFEISLKLRDLFRIAGYSVVMTREKDKSIHDSDAKSLKQKKSSDLNNRVKIIEQNSSGDNTILISIHQNKFPNEKYSGAQIFYSENNALSENLANSIRNVIVTKLQPDNKRELKSATSKIFLLKKSNIPSITIECGFLSNKDEAHKLNTSDYQKSLALSIFCGTIRYWSGETSSVEGNTEENNE